MEERIIENHAMGYKPHDTHAMALRVLKIGKSKGQSEFLVEELEGGRFKQIFGGA